MTKVETEAEWLTIDYEPFSRTFMVDMYFDGAPPENKKFAMGLGLAEMRELRDRIDQALQAFDERRAGK